MNGMACVVAVAIALGALTRPCPAAAKAEPAMDRYYNANALCKRGLYPLAIKEYEAFLAVNPAHEKVPNAQWGLALCHYGMGAMDKAAALFERLAGNARVTDQDQLHNLWGSSLAVLGKQAEAVKAFEWTLKNAKEQALKADALAGLTQAHSLLEDWPAAVRTSEDLIKLAPDSPYADLVRYQGAVARMNLKQYAEAEKTLTTLAATFPRNAMTADCIDTIFYLGLCRARQKKYDDAIKDFTEAARRAGESPRAPEALYWQAWCETQRGNLRQAESLYTADRLLPAATLDLAELRFRQQQQSPEPGKAKGGRRAAEVDYASIAEALRPLLAEDSKTPATGELRSRVLYLLGWCLFRQGEMGPAAQAFETLVAAEEAAAKADPAYRTGPLVASACFQAGEARRNLKEFGPAKELFEKAARLRGAAATADQDDMLLRLAQLEAINGQWQESLRTAQTLLQSFPESPLRYEALFAIGWELYA